MPPSNSNNFTSSNQPIPSMNPSQNSIGMAIEQFNNFTNTNGNEFMDILEAITKDCSQSNIKVIIYFIYFMILVLKKNLKKKKKRKNSLYICTFIKQNKNKNKNKKKLRSSSDINESLYTFFSYIYIYLKLKLFKF